VRLTLLTRAYCHLCDEMRAEVAALATAAAVAVDEIAGDRELFHYRVDRTVLTTYLASAADQVSGAP
jgi:hypothetical protein